MHAGRLTAARPAVRVDARGDRARDGGRRRARCGLRRAARCRLRWRRRAVRGRSRSRSLVAALFVAWAGAPVGRTYALIFEGGFGSRFAWSETLTRATPLILTGLAAAIAFRAHFYNIGAEGQLYAGALAAVAVGGLAGGTGFDLPLPLLCPRMVVAAMRSPARC